MPPVTAVTETAAAARSEPAARALLRRVEERRPVVASEAAAEREAAEPRPVAEWRRVERAAAARRVDGPLAQGERMVGAAVQRTRKCAAVFACLRVQSSGATSPAARSARIRLPTPWRRAQEPRATSSARPALRRAAIAASRREPAVRAMAVRGTAARATAGRVTGARVEARVLRLNARAVRLSWARSAASATALVDAESWDSPAIDDLRRHARLISVTRPARMPS